MSRYHLSLSHLYSFRMRILLYSFEYKCCVYTLSLLQNIYFIIIQMYIQNITSYVQINMREYLSIHEMVISLNMDMIPSLPPILKAIKFNYDASRRSRSGKIRLGLL